MSKEFHEYGKKRRKYFVDQEKEKLLNEFREKLEELNPDFTNADEDAGGLEEITVVHECAAINDDVNDANSFHVDEVSIFFVYLVLLCSKFKLCSVDIF